MPLDTTTESQLLLIEADLALGKEVFIQVVSYPLGSEKWVQLTVLRPATNGSVVDPNLLKCQIVDDDDVGGPEWRLLEIDAVVTSYQKAQQIPELPQIMRQRREQKTLWNQKLTDKSPSDEGMRQRINLLTPAILAWICAKFYPEALDSAQRALAHDFYTLAESLVDPIECDAADFTNLLESRRFKKIRYPLYFSNSWEDR